MNKEEILVEDNDKENVGDILKAKGMNQQTFKIVTFQVFFKICSSYLGLLF